MLKDFAVLEDAEEQDVSTTVNMNPPNLIRIYGNIKAMVIWGLELNPKSEKIDFSTSTWCLDQWGWSLSGTLLMDEDSK